MLVTENNTYSLNLDFGGQLAFESKVDSSAWQGSHASALQTYADLLFSKSSFSVQSQNACTAEKLQEESTSFTCTSESAYLKYDAKLATLSAGKRVFLVSQSILSSPANPTSVGFIQGGPTERKEGVWLSESQFFLGDNVSLSIGTFFSDFQIKNDFSLVPYVRGRLSASPFDTTLVAARNFLGAFVLLQANDKILFLAEGNIHRSASDNTGSRKIASDFLLGMNTTPEWLAHTFQIEFLRNAHGLAGSGTLERLQSSQESSKQDREETYAAPTPHGLGKPRYGNTNFLSKDLFAIHLFSGEQNKGLKASAIYSVNDESRRLSLGYFWSFVPKNVEDSFFAGIEWAGFQGTTFSEFGLAADSKGRNTVRLVFGMN